MRRVNSDRNGGVSAEYVEGELDEIKRRLTDLERRIEVDRSAVVSKEKIITGKIGDVSSQVRLSMF